MTWTVHQHWDPLKVCVVGRSYPPEFYSWITVPHVRKLFEKIAFETEEDYQVIIKKLKEFDVKILRPEISEISFINGRYMPPPMTPRDYFLSVGDVFYENYSFDFCQFYQNVKDSTWPECKSMEEFVDLPKWIQHECVQTHKLPENEQYQNSYDHVIKKIHDQGNKIKSYRYDPKLLNGAQVSRIGKDLYFGTETYSQDTRDYQKFIDSEFQTTRNHIVNTGGHSDGTYCPVCPGLIISQYDIPAYTTTFPGWEVVYLPPQSWDRIKPFLHLKNKNNGKWWIPGFEHDNSVIEVVETWLRHWTGYVEETVFDVNMLIIDPKNVMVFNYNKQMFDALERYGITPHVVPFRHRYFWDGGIHCITSDLHREGPQQDFFPGRA